MREILFTILLIFICLPVSSQSMEISSGRKAVKRSGDVLFVTAPVVCLSTTLILQDWEGLKQGALSGVTSLGTSLILKYSIKKERPDGSDLHSFPSAHTAISFTSAAFLQRRYGWSWEIPAYALASYVGWSRTYAKKHDWWDVVTGAALGAGSAYIFTRPFADTYKLSLSPVATGKQVGLYASLVF